MKGGEAVQYFLFHLGMNSISLRARFTEPTRENKDVLIRNIRGEKVIAVVNELHGCLWVWYTSLLGCSDEKTKKKKNLFHSHQTRLCS